MLIRLSFAAFEFSARRAFFSLVKARLIFAMLIRLAFAAFKFSARRAFFSLVKARLTFALLIRLSLAAFEFSARRAFFALSIRRLAFIRFISALFVRLSGLLFRIRLFAAVLFFHFFSSSAPKRVPVSIFLPVK